MRVGAPLPLPACASLVLRSPADFNKRNQCLPHSPRCLPGWVLTVPPDASQSLGPWRPGGLEVARVLLADGPLWG